MRPRFGNDHREYGKVVFTHRHQGKVVRKWRRVKS